MLKEKEQKVEKKKEKEKRKESKNDSSPDASGSGRTVVEIRRPPLLVGWWSEGEVKVQGIKASDHDSLSLSFTAEVSTGQVFKRKEETCNKTH